MARVDLRSLAPLVRVELPQAVSPAVTLALRLAAAQFCDRTRCWRHKHVVTVPDPVPDPADYSVTLDGTVLVSIETITREGRGAPLDPILSVDSLRPASARNAFASTDDFTVLLIGAEPGKHTVSCWLKPASFPAPGLTEDAANLVPSAILDTHSAALAAGALARLYRQAGPGQNFDAAAYHARIFDQAIAAAAAHHLRGPQRAPIRTRSAWF